MLAVLLMASTMSSRVHAAEPGQGITIPLPFAEPGQGITIPFPFAVDSVRWPEEVRPLAILDGPAILAAHAALQQVLTRVPKEYAGTCAYSAKAMDVVIGQEAGLYFVRINPRADRCGVVLPSGAIGFDWFELYAVSPEGKVLARYPHWP
ncbi:MAG TPA: hypothetical protein VF794_12875 [Archangium sp.]|jgi:hypothetical protein|uniref:hypothetical protein n=1 Tax=Archangium sp. TaxID=1872627 RepID=UPI002ED896C9